MAHGALPGGRGRLADRVARLEVLEDEEAVRARVAELAAQPLPPLVFRTLGRFAAAAAQRDWEALEECCAPTGRLEDRRRGVVTVPEAAIGDVIGDIARSYAALGDDVAWGVEPVGTPASLGVAGSP